VVWLTVNFKIRTCNCPGEKHYCGNQQLTVREVAEEVGISIGSRHTTSTEDLGMARFSTKYVPRLLTGDQKLQRFSISENLLQVSLPVMRCGFTVKMLNETTIFTLEESCFA
jgi:hypothetical protein